MLSKPLGHQECPKWNEGDDENWEADGGNGLRYGYCACDTEYLYANEQPDLLLRDIVEGIVELDEPMFGHEVPELCEDAVGFDRAPLYHGQYE